MITLSWNSARKNMCIHFPMRPRITYYNSFEPPMMGHGWWTS